jgi:hypothetical protein
MDKELKEKIAVNAANMWCRCFKCDGKVNATGCTCEKNKLLTCRKWYDGYRTALLAISDYEQQLMAKTVDGEVGYWNLRGLSINTDLPHSVSEGDKVKIIVIKEE